MKAAVGGATLNHRLDDANPGRFGASRSKIYPIRGALARTCLTFAAFKARLLWFHRAPECAVMSRASFAA
jgi:hypothetical protein